MINNCKVCRKDFEILEKSRSHKEGTCSYNCLRKTGLVRLRFLRSALKTREIDCLEVESVEDLEKKYSKIMSEITKKSTIKKHKTIKEKYGDISNCYQLSGQKSHINRMKNFLEQNNISYNFDISEKELQKIFVFYFDSITNHGEKIKQGRLKKHGTKENVIKSYKDGTIKTVRNFYKIDDNTFNMLNEEEINFMIKSYKKDINFFNHNAIKWKTTHLTNLGINSDLLSNDIINKLYSEYMSERFTTNSLHVISNGYKKSKKGWFKFSNINLNYFYRSSWELKVLEILNILITKGKIINVFEPDRISYNFENRDRNYYPDVGVVLTNNTKVIIEIKPQSKLSDPINIEKFSAAKKQIENFIVLTENEIFSENLELILLNGVINV